jgi:hypothetical protein
MRPQKGFLLLSYSYSLVLYATLGLVLITGLLGTSQLIRNWSLRESKTVIAEARLLAMTTQEDQEIHITAFQLSLPPLRHLSVCAGHSFVCNVQKLGFKASGRAKYAGSLWIDTKNSSPHLSVAVGTGKVSYYP